MKQRLTTPFIVLACVLIFATAGIAWPLNSVQAAPAAEASGPVCNTGRSVQVSGTAVVNVTPDRVLIQLGVQSNGITPQFVEAANSKTINRVIQGGSTSTGSTASRHSTPYSAV